MNQTPETTTTLHPDGTLEIHGYDTAEAFFTQAPRGLVRCGTCGRVWDEVNGNAAPAARCPFEYDHDDESTPAERLEYLRGEIRAERISQGELDELQGLAEHIDPGDVELLEWAGVPEHDDEPEPEPGRAAVIAEHDHSAVAMADTIVRERAERAALAAAVAEVWAEDMPSTYRNRKVCELVRETLETGELPTDRRVEKLRTANAMLAESLNTLAAEKRRLEDTIETLRRQNGNQFRAIQTIREIDPELVRRVQDGEV